MDSIMKAADCGDISAFYREIPRNPHILEQLDDLPFAQTPLHVAASKGHGRFFIELMRLMPSLARKLNCDGFSPLHLALVDSKMDLTRMILRIVHVDPELIRVKSKEGITLLHYVAELGKLTLLSEFLSICPESINDMTIQGQTALHIAAKHVQHSAIEVLLGWLERGFYQEVINLKQKVVNWQDDEGNTVLHIAALMNDPMLGKLILASGVVDLDLKDFEGRTPLILQNTLQVGNAELQRLLESASSTPAHATSTSPLEIYLSSRIVPFERMVIQLFGGNNGKATQVRGGLLVVAVLVATATYNAGINPPGGVWSSSDKSHMAGTVIMEESLFYVFQVFNATAFCASMGLIFVLLPSGIFLLLLQYSLVACYMLSMVILSPTYISRCAFSVLLIFISLVLGLYFFSFLRFNKAFRQCMQMIAPSSTEKWQDQSEAIKEVGSKRFISSFVFMIFVSMLATAGFIFLALTNFDPIRPRR
ncbi:hypothetical protein QQ045_008650 [Rhodiola kirilowii]